jgi:Endonuclease-reverse transcriptase
MSITINSLSQQFNKYKYDELSEIFLPLVHDLSHRQKQIGLETLYDCCWTLKRQDLSNYWQQQYKEPKLSSCLFSILHYNIRSFYSNQADLTEMVNVNSPTIISINELGTTVPDKSIKQLLFTYNIYTKEGTNSHGGVVLAVDKKLKCQLVDLNEPNIIAVQTSIDDQQFVIASIYSPPTEQLPITAMSTLLNISKNIIIIGDLNAKHHDWGCPQINTKGRVLADWIINHNLNVLNSGIKTSLRSNTTIDLFISSEVPETSQCHSLAYAGSDHLPLLTKFLGLNTSADIHLVPRTYWKVYSSILTVLHDQLQVEQEILINNSSNTFNWFIIFENFLAALKLRVTVWQKVKRKRPSISPSLQILLRHKHYLQNKYRHTKFEEDRLRLRSWNFLVKQEFQAHRQRNWEQFITNVASPNPTKFWQTVKKLNKKKSVDFSALSEDNTIHKTPVDIVKC